MSTPEEIERGLLMDAEDAVRCLRCPCGGGYHGIDGQWICTTCRKVPSIGRLIAGAYLLGISGGKFGHAERVAADKTEKWETRW
jgi:hypothetical protein